MAAGGVQQRRSPIRPWPPRSGSRVVAALLRAGDPPPPALAGPPAPRPAPAAPALGATWAAYLRASRVAPAPHARVRPGRWCLWRLHLGGLSSRARATLEPLGC